MPIQPSNAKLWYYSDFLTVTQNKQLLPNQPEDWKRLQVWNGETLVQALPDGAQANPTDEQIQQLYDHMRNGTLFLFALGEAEPMQFDFSHLPVFSLNPQPPVMPEAPVLEPLEAPKVPNPFTMENPDSLSPEDKKDFQNQWTTYENKVTAQNEIKAKHASSMEWYEENQERYNSNVQLLETMGDGFKKAVNDFNKDRNLEQETKEANAREQNAEFVVEMRKRENADRVISNVMNRRPVALPEVFFSSQREVHRDKTGEQHSDATFSYDVYNKHMEHRSYSLPREVDLTEDEIATINFAMLGAKTHMAQYTLKNMEEGGPVSAHLRSTQGFNMMLTGIFGKTRKHQPTAEHLGEALNLGKQMVYQYIEGNVDELGKNLAECVQNIKSEFSSCLQDNFTREMVAATKLTERLLQLFERKPDILAATKLQKADLDFMRGYVEMGRIYDSYVNSNMKLNRAEALDIELKPEEKTEILVDAIIRRMVEKEIEAGNQRAQESPRYMQLAEEYQKKDEVLREKFHAWLKEEHISSKDKKAYRMATERYVKNHDLEANTSQLASYPGDHKMIQMLGRPGTLERLRQALRSDPAVIAQAQQPHFGLQKKKSSETNVLFKGTDLDALVQRVHPALEESYFSQAQKHDWFVSMKAMLSQGKVTRDRDAVSPWINSKVPGDRDRLLVAVDNGDGTKSLQKVAQLLENGLQDLQNPSAKTIQMLHKHAQEGNLYYYDVGKDMPLRLNVDGEKASFEPLTEPRPEPGFWRWLLNKISRGALFAEYFQPEPPERDPQVKSLFLDAREERGLAAQNEDAQRRALISKPKDLVMGAEKTNEEAEAVQDARAQMREGIDATTDRVRDFQLQPDSGAKLSYPAYKDGEVTHKLLMGIVNADKEKSMTITNLRMDVSQSVTYTVDNKVEDPETIRRAMAKLVLLEKVIAERNAAQDGKIGPYEAGVKENAKGMEDALMNNAVFQAFTRNPNQAMLRHFIMIDAAKIVQSYIPDGKQAPEMQQKNDGVQNQEAEKQAGGKMVGL